VLCAWSEWVTSVLVLETSSSVASENESAHRISDVQFMRQIVHRIEQDMSDECVCHDLQVLKLAQVVQVAEPTHDA